MKSNSWVVEIANIQESGEQYNSHVHGNIVKFYKNNAPAQV